MSLNFFIPWVLLVISCVTRDPDRESKTVVSPGEKLVISPQKVAFVDIPSQKKLKARLSELEAMLAKDRENSDLKKQSIDLNFLLGNYKEVIKLGREILTGGNTEISLRIKIANASLMERKMSFATFVLSVPECTKSSECQNLLGIVEYQKNKIIEALSYFKKAVSLDSKNVSPSLNLALVYLEYYKFDDAMDEVNGILKVAKKNPNALFHRSILLNHRGEEKKALAAMEKLLEEDKNNPYILHNIAVIYLKLREFDNALSALNRALKYAQEYQVKIDPLIKLKEDTKLQQSSAER